MEHPEVDLLFTLIRLIVDDKDAIKVERTESETEVLLILDVAKPDMGKVIGREGNTARAIRTLLRVVGMRNNHRVNLKINEPFAGEAVDNPLADQPF